MKSTYLYKIVKPHEQLIKFALSVVVHLPIDVFPLACGRVFTGLWTCFHWPVDVLPLASGRQLKVQT